MQRAEWERKTLESIELMHRAEWQSDSNNHCVGDNQDELDDHNRGKIEKPSDPDEEVPVKNTTEA